MCESCGKRCDNCGKIRKKYTDGKHEGSKGLCQSCYEYKRRNGCTRPMDYDARYRRTHFPTCKNCGKVRKRRGAQKGSLEGAQGMCGNCYWWFKKFGRMRKPEEMPKPVQKGLCRHCRQAMIFQAGLCRSCLSYRSRTGKMRPRRLLRETCSNCGVPFNGYRTLTGRCKRCKDYHNRYHIERPAHIWQSEHGWCECSTGKTPVKATHTVKMAVGKHVENVPMCDECYSIHMQHIKWYGGDKRVAAMAGDD